MGEHDVKSERESGQLRSFMKRLLADLRALERMLEEGRFEEGVCRIGAEQELFLIDESWRPAPVAMEILAAIDDPHFTTELGLFNLEMNLDPAPFTGDCLSRMETQLHELLGRARATCAALGYDVVLTGILPTLRKSDLELSNMTPKPRYFALNDAMTRLRGSAYEFKIKGVDELQVKHDSVMVEACNASFQVHLQVDPPSFARLYNLAQVLAGPVMAAAVNSPMLFGRRLWAETRIALFQQAVDTRSTSHHLREMSPRVSFGRRWVDDSVLELYREDIVRFRALLDVEGDENPFLKLERGEAPELKALRLHNGTIYRWNRACYGITDGKPHLRIENRVLPSGPSVVDEVANAAFWLGLMRAMPREHPNVAEELDFDVAKDNFHNAARYGMKTQFEWFGGETVAARDLILRLIPIAREGLEAAQVAPADADRYLGVMQQRIERGRTGARWIADSFTKMLGHGTPGERLNALTAAMARRQREGRPVSEWEPAEIAEAGGWKHNYTKVEQYMTTDLFTVHEDDLLDLVANLMDWEKIRHVPVEDEDHRLVGLISYRTLLRVLARGTFEGRSDPVAVGEVMKRNPTTVSPETSTLAAIDLMRTRKIGCLPVVKDGRLIGVVTEREFMDIAAEMLEQRLRE